MNALSIKQLNFDANLLEAKWNNKIVNLGYWTLLFLNTTLFSKKYQLFSADTYFLDDNFNCFSFLHNSHGLVGHRTHDNHDDFKSPLIVVYYDVDYVKNPKGKFNFLHFSILHCLV